MAVSDQIWIFMVMVGFIPVLAAVVYWFATRRNRK